MNRARRRRWAEDDGDADIGSDWSPPTFSSDGSVIAFATDASLTVADTNGKRDVYVARVTVNDAPEFNTTTVEETIDEDTTYDDFRPDGEGRRPGRGHDHLLRAATACAWHRQHRQRHRNAHLHAEQGLLRARPVPGSGDGFARCHASVPLTYAITVKPVDDAATDVVFRQTVSSLNETSTSSPSRTTVVGKITIDDIDGFDGDFTSSDDRFDILQTDRTSRRCACCPARSSTGSWKPPSRSTSPPMTASFIARPSKSRSGTSMNSTSPCPRTWIPRRTRCGVPPSRAPRSG